MKILIQGGRIINPASGLDTAADMAIANGRILTIGNTPPDFTPDTTLNARGCLVLPGLVDLAARLRKRFEQGGHSGKFIKTVYGAGYLLATPVSWS